MFADGKLVRILRIWNEKCWASHQQHWMLTGNSFLQNLGVKVIPTQVCTQLSYPFHVGRHFQAGRILKRFPRDALERKFKETEKGVDEILNSEMPKKAQR